MLYVWRGDRANAGAPRSSLSSRRLPRCVLSWFVFYQHFTDEFRAAFTRMFAQPGAAAGVAPNAAGRDQGQHDAAGARLERRPAGRRRRRLAAADAGGPRRVESGAATHARSTDVGADGLGRGVAGVVGVDRVRARGSPPMSATPPSSSGRINLATIPLVAILAARGAAIGWEPETPDAARRPLQVGAALLCIAAFALAVQAWLGWFSRDLELEARVAAVFRLRDALKSRLRSFFSDERPRPQFVVRAAEARLRCSSRSVRTTRPVPPAACPTRAGTGCRARRPGR